MNKADTTRKYVTTKKYNKLVEQIEHLQEQLNEANTIINGLNSIRQIGDYKWLVKWGNDYKEKWGVK